MKERKDDFFKYIFYLAAATTACRAYNSSEDSFVRVAPKIKKTIILILLKRRGGAE
jgi:hypothetical protein